MAKTIKCYDCECGEEFYEDDVTCINCGTPVDPSRFVEREVAEITHETVPARSTTVGENLPRQLARVREIQRHATEIGPAGAFLVAICEAALREAEAAIASGDVLRVVRAYGKLRDFKE
jgi:hypothetical protein